MKEFFHSYANGFDRIYARDRSLRGAIDRVLRRSMYERFDYTLAAFQEGPLGSVLDVGCGSGRYAVALALLGATKVVGIDVAEGMLDIARLSAANAGVSDRCEFMLYDFEAAELDTTFDYSIAMGLFDYVNNPEPFVRKMLAATRHRFLASFPSFSLLRSPQRKIRYAVLHRCPVYFYKQSDIVAMLRRSGATDFQVIKLPGGPGSDLLADVRLS